MPFWKKAVEAPKEAMQTPITLTVSCPACKEELEVKTTKEIIEIHPYNWEHRRNEIMFFSILFALLGFGAFFGLKTGFDQMKMPEFITLYLSGIISFVGVILLVWLLTNKSVRRGISDVLMFNKRLAIAEIFGKNRRLLRFDVKIPKGTGTIKFPGMKDEKGEPLEYDLVQRPDVDDETNRTFYVFKEKARNNINDFIQEDLPELDVEESLMREKDMDTAYQKVKRETQGKEKINIWLWILILVALTASIMSLISNYIKH